MTTSATRTGNGSRGKFIARLADGRPTTTCRICLDEPIRMVVNGLIVGGASTEFISKNLGVLGMGVAKRDLNAHRKKCLDNSAVVAQTDLAAQENRVDFAEMVRAKAVAKLRAGELDVTTQHGLQAQALIDRRDEKTQDRDLMLSLARVMSGAIGVGPPAALIEGDYVDITPDGVLPGWAEDGEQPEANGWLGTVVGDKEAV